MIKISKESISDRIKSYAISNYKKLDTKDFVLGDAPFNRMCHLNAVQKIREGRAEKVFLCYTYDTKYNSHCVHFINQLADGHYQDNTWGWTYEQNEYYIIKEINNDEQKNVGELLRDCKKMLVNTNSTAFERFIFRINTDNFI